MIMTLCDRHFTTFLVIFLFLMFVSEFSSLILTLIYFEKLVYCHCKTNLIFSPILYGYQIFLVQQLKFRNFTELFMVDLSQ